MRFTYSERLPALLAQIEDYLVLNTPTAVAKLRVTDPAYAVFLWYDDSSAAGDYAPDFGVGTDSMRSTCARRYPEKESSNDCLWRPQQVISELVPKGKFRDRGYIAACNEAYALMLAANQTGLPLEDEGELLRPFRSMMHRVANRLNGLDWPGSLKTVKEFVVVAADRVGYWLTEDMRASLPPAKLKSLQRMGLLPALVEAEGGTAEPLYGLESQEGAPRTGLTDPV